MDTTHTPINFTGEFFVPGKSGSRIEADHRERYRFACKFAQNKSILDIACGMGYAAPLFINAGAISYDGVDLNEKLIDHANNTYGDNRVNYHVGDICSFTNAINFDIITCFETIEHILHYESAINNLYRLLKKGGMLLISSPNRRIMSRGVSSLADKPRNKYHVQEFIPEELLTILRKHGFAADNGGIYGQRQGRASSNRFIHAISRAFSAMLSSPIVTPLTNKVPRYFIIAAKKV